MSEPAEPPRSRARRSLRAFGLFWWDFLVGDTPELTLATAVIVAVTAVLAGAGYKTAAWVTLPVLVVVALLVSVRKGRAG